MYCPQPQCPISPQTDYNYNFSLGPTQHSTYLRPNDRLYNLKNGGLWDCSWMHPPPPRDAPGVESNRQFIHAGELKPEAAVKFTRATVAYSAPDKPHLNNSHIAPPLYLRVYPSETRGALLIKLSDTAAAAPLLINNELRALLCIFGADITDTPPPPLLRL